MRLSDRRQIGKWQYFISFRDDDKAIFGFCVNIKINSLKLIPPQTNTGYKSGPVADDGAIDWEKFDRTWEGEACW